MFDCRYYDLCCFTDDSCNGEPECPKRDHCQFYSPMPDVKALLGLADEMLSASIEISIVDSIRPLEAAYLIQGYARRIREALGVVGRDR